MHVLGAEGYTATDILARYKRMRGFNVLHPIAWDAFGLPAEQYALQTGTHPAVTTQRNINRFREQLQSLGVPFAFCSTPHICIMKHRRLCVDRYASLRGVAGVTGYEEQHMLGFQIMSGDTLVTHRNLGWLQGFSYDWDREFSTTDPEYYKWTQWIFLQLHRRGLAYQAEVPVNWCPELGTVLANEEVIDGKSERGAFPVVRMPMRQVPSSELAIFAFVVISGSFLEVRSL